MLRPINGHRHLLAGVNITEHAVKRYRERRNWLETWGIPQPPIFRADSVFSDDVQLQLMLLAAKPCDGIPEVIREERSRRHGGETAYQHHKVLGVRWRFVINPHDRTLCTVEPDIHEDDFGGWRDVPPAVHFFKIHGFTVEEITGGVIRSAYR